MKSYIDLVVHGTAERFRLSEHRQCWLENAPNVVHTASDLLGVDPASLCEPCFIVVENVHCGL